MRQGRIVTVTNLPGSGVATLIIQEFDRGTPTSIPADNGPLVRLLDDMFPGFITGHRYNPDVIRGKYVRFDLDELGLLAALEAIDC